MPRPAPDVVHTVTFDDGLTWDILATDSLYAILYRGKPVSIRSSSVIRATFKYFKGTYPHLGSVKAQVRRLNKRFNCEDFTYVKLI